MPWVTLIFMSVFATCNAQVSLESCQVSDNVLEDFLEWGISPMEVGFVHFPLDDALCFDEPLQPSCCTVAMENAFENQVEDSFGQKHEQLMTDCEGSIQNHVEEFDHFVLFVIQSTSREVVSRLRRTFGILLSGTLDEVNNMYLSMAKYFSRGEITGRDIVVSFLESLYIQLTQQLFGRSSKRYTGCTLTIMNETYPNFFEQKIESLTSAVAQPMLYFRAYSQSFRSLRKVFRRLKHITLTSECKKNLIRATKCPFCLGHGQNLPPCQSLCTTVVGNCTHFSDGVFFDSLVGYINALTPVAQSVGLLDVREVPVIIGEAVQEFHSFSEATRRQVERSCGETLYNVPTDVPVTEIQEDVKPFRDYSTFAQTVRAMHVLNNITQNIFNHDYFCDITSPSPFPCWNGTHVTSNINQSFPIYASDAPPEVLKEAKTLKRISAKLKKEYRDRHPCGHAKTKQIDTSAGFISEQQGQASGSLGLSREITLKERMNNRTKLRSGDRVVLKCAIEGDPQAEYQWFKDEVLLTEEMMGDRMEMKTFRWGSKLIISRAYPSDSGHYRCNGRNPYGERSTTGLLAVRMRECPNQWHHFGTSCYLKISARTFTSALEECQSTNNGHLVSIQSVEENEFITSFAEREKAWIGVSMTEDGLLYWLNGDEWTFDVMTLSQSNISSCFAINDIHPGIWSSSNCGNLKIAVCEVSLL